MEQYPKRRGGVAARIILGILVCSLLISAAFGVQSLIAVDEVNALLSSQPDTDDFRNVFLTIELAVAVPLVAPAVPAILLGVFAAHPTRATTTAARVAIVLWWVLLVLALIAFLLQAGTMPSSFVNSMSPVLVLAVVPAAIGSICVHLIARSDPSLNDGTWA